LWLELSSVSWFSDYQARRANVRWRPTAAKGTAFCHTVNGSAMGWSRTLATYLETHRQPDGSIAIVEALQPYVGGAELIPAP
jgi:seryl-tRNA synthetase